jgi:hypothetical protein
MMIKALEEAIRRVRELPEDRQVVAAKALELVVMQECDAARQCRAVARRGQLCLTWLSVYQGVDLAGGGYPPFGGTRHSAHLAHCVKSPTAAHGPGSRLSKQERS